MKTKFYHLLFLGSFWLMASQAQASIYYSKGFEKKGVTEFIYFTMMGEAQYWSTAMEQKTPVNLISSKFTNGYATQVRFGKGQPAYKLTKHDQVLICTHPNGKVQNFKFIPHLLISKGFEKKGVNEFLQQDGATWYYFTNQSTKKIRMQISGQTSLADPFKMNFPGNKTLYTITLMPLTLECKHPDGRKQVYAICSLSMLAQEIRSSSTVEKLIQNN